MSENRNSKALLILYMLSTLLPWFTYDAGLMGYRRGILFWMWFLLPMVVTAVAIFGKRNRKSLLLLGELGLLGNLAALVVTFGRWQEVCNIVSGYHWKDGFHTAQWGFWLSCILFAALSIVYQAENFGKDKKPSQP